jgi:response regulator RpfG family c-di-GMP phosphodiesterase
VSGLPGAPRVLLVDDEPRVLESLVDLLRREFRVSSTSDPDEAVAALAAGDVALVVSDQRMPRLSGAELLARAAALCPDTVRMLLTAYSDVEAVIRGVNEGHMYYYLAKPWDPEGMVGRVREAVGIHRELREHRRIVAELTSLADPLGTARLHVSLLQGGAASLSDANVTLRGALARVRELVEEVRQIREVVPVCMACGRVKRADASWQDIVRYLSEHSEVLSHGLCPDCVEGWRARFLERRPEEGERGT